MKNYRVEHWAWIEGSGWSYNETIDNVDERITSADLGKIYSDYCSNAGDEIRVYDNESGELLSSWEK